MFTLLLLLMALPSTDAFGAGAGVLANPPWTQSGVSVRTVNYDGAGHAKASAIDSGVVVGAIVNDNTFQADHYGQATIVSGLAAGTNYAAIWVRGAKDGTASSYQGYEVNTDGASGAGNTELYKYTNGSPALIGNYAATFTSGDVMKVTISGTTISLYKNGALIGTPIVDSTFSRTGAPGIGMFNGSANNVLMDDFTGDDLVPLIPPAPIRFQVALAPQQRVG